MILQQQFSVTVFLFLFFCPHYIEIRDGPKRYHCIDNYLKKKHFIYSMNQDHTSDKRVRFFLSLVLHKFNGDIEFPLLVCFSSF